MELTEICEVEGCDNPTLCGINGRSVCKDCLDYDLRQVGSVLQQLNDVATNLTVRLESD